MSKGRSLRRSVSTVGLPLRTGQDLVFRLPGGPSLHGKSGAGQRRQIMQPRLGLTGRAAATQGRRYAPTLGCDTLPRWGRRRGNLPQTSGMQSPSLVPNACVVNAVSAAPQPQPGVRPRAPGWRPAPTWGTPSHTPQRHSGLRNPPAAYRRLNPRHIAPHFPAGARARKSTAMPSPRLLMRTV